MSGLLGVLRTVVTAHDRVSEDRESLTVEPKKPLGSNFLELKTPSPFPRLRSK